MPKQALLGRFKSFSFWLIPIVLIFFISALASLIQLKQSKSILDERYGTSVWALFQLRSELIRFHDALSIFKENTVTLEQLHERYDILWSRFPAVLEGVDGEHIAQIDGAIEQLSDSFDFIQAIENEVFNVLPQNPAYISSLQFQLRPHIKAIEKLSINNHQLNNDFYNRGDKRISELQQQLIWLMIGLIATGSALLFMLLKENRTNRHMARHDSLTKMPNRSFLKLRLDEACEKGAPFGFHLLDLNKFKDVNDTLGHHTGDLLLKAVSQRLREGIDQPYNCITCRLGGDEFAIIQYDLKDISSLSLVAENIIQILGVPFILNDNTCHIGVSIGSTAYPDHAQETHKLLARADIAMYQAKESSRTSKYVLFNYGMDAEINRKQQIQRDLREAINNNQLHLVYQPILSLNGKKISYAEALLRWNHDQYGPISPLEIVAIAEQYGIAQELGCWVINEACRQIKSWQTLGEDIFPVSVNISPSMYRLDLASIINDLQKQHGIEAGCIRVEVTEDTALHVINSAKEVFSDCKKQMISLALDDFGTGLSSLSHLQKLPVQTLKIDKSFINRILQDHTSERLVKTMINIGHELNMEVVAEGIESEAISQLLHKLKCDYGQGFYYSKPLLPDLIPDMIAQWTRGESLAQSV